MPAENLISPDAVRRLSWEPPDPPDEAAIAAALAGYGARPWQTGTDRRADRRRLEQAPAGSP